MEEMTMEQWVETLPKELMERRSRVLTQVISLLVTAIDGTKRALRKK